MDGLNKVSAFLLIGQTIFAGFQRLNVSLKIKVELVKSSHLLVYSSVVVVVVIVVVVCIVVSMDRQTYCVWFIPHKTPKENSDK